MLKQDQLLQEKAAGAAFAEFTEGPIEFAPTYKYLSGTNEFERREKGKKRIPAWCDRIQWYARSLCPPGCRPLAAHGIVCVQARRGNPADLLPVRPRMLICRCC